MYTKELTHNNKPYVGQVSIKEDQEAKRLYFDCQIVNTTTGTVAATAQSNTPISLKLEVRERYSDDMINSIWKFAIKHNLV